MASVQRTRSLRKPASAAPSTATGPAPKLPAPTTQSSRGTSPSRLPIKPTSSRPRSMIVAPSAKPAVPPKTVASTASSTARLPSTATAGTRSRPVSATLSRSTSLSKRQTPPAQQQPPPPRTSRPPITTTNRPRPAPTATRSRRASAEIEAVAKPPVPASPARQASHTRTKSSVTTSLRPPSVDKKPTDAAASTPRAHAQGHKRALTVDRIRPVLTTLQQQHASPARTASPTKGPPSPSKLPANVAASAETSRLQAELLQLHLLHRDAAATEAQWHASAQRKLGHKFAALSKDTARVAARERSAAEEDNVLALRRWGRQGVLQDKIRALDDVFAGVWELTGPGGRYDRCVNRFERWIDHVMDVEEARVRVSEDADDDDGVLFAGQMDDAWRGECVQMETKLRAWKARLDGLGERPDAGSSLDKMLEGATALVVGALAETEAMQMLERHVAAKEEAWVDAVNREGENDVKDTRAGAVWRAI